MTQNHDGMKSEIRWLFIKYNTPHELGLVPLEKYKNLTTPILELNFEINYSHFWEISSLGSNQIVSLLLSTYQDLVKEKKYYPGNYGDWIKTTIVTISNKKFLNLDLIAQAAWHKPTLAADLGIFIKDKQKIFFVGVTRLNPPAKDKPALIGGIMNIQNTLDSGIYTMIKEAREEVNFIAEYLGDLEELRENYMMTTIPIEVKNFEKISPRYANLKTQIHFVMTIPTTEQERNENGTKRVYATIAYCVLVNLSEIIINIDDIRKILQAGDDAASLFIQDVTGAFHDLSTAYIPCFGLDHHPQLFRSMIKTLQQKEKKTLNF